VDLEQIEKDAKNDVLIGKLTWLRLLAYAIKLRDQLRQIKELTNQ
jgi:hypothetical protein